MLGNQRKMSPVAWQPHRDSRVGLPTLPIDFIRNGNQDET